MKLEEIYPDIQTTEGGVTAAKGFMASSCAAGIKYKDRDDMALVYTERPASAGGAFTKNLYAAAPVIYDREILKQGHPVHAVVLNSGIANAATGLKGKEMNLMMASEVARCLNIRCDEVFTASTGVIGYQMPDEPLRKGAKLLTEGLSDSIEAGLAAQKAIMTTDTVSKQAACAIEIDGKKVTVGGMAKGSGMIHPDMATMLSVITTDADIEKELLQKLTLDVVGDSFNMISVDRDTSTNDTYLVLANGASGVTIERDSDACNKFKSALEYVSKSLARKLAKDGEGATKLIEVTAKGLREKDDAKKLAKAVICSSLVKTMVFGCDANSGRILDALGYAGVCFDPESVDVDLIRDGDSIRLAKDGVIQVIDEEKASEWMRSDEVVFLCDFKQGDKEATAWGCDLTYDYVKINGDYRS